MTQESRRPSHVSRSDLPCDWLEYPKDDSSPVVRAHHPDRLAIAPREPRRVSGIWLAQRGPRRSGRHQQAALSSWLLLLRIGSNTPISLFNRVQASSIGVRRSESFEITTASSKSSSNAFGNRSDARLPKEPLSPVSRISTVRGPVRGGFDRGRRFVFESKCQ